MRHMHIKLYFRINPIPRLEIDRAVTNGSAVYILLGEILCPPPLCLSKLHPFFIFANFKNRGRGYNLKI